MAKHVEETKSLITFASESKANVVIRGNEGIEHSVCTGISRIGQAVCIIPGKHTAHFGYSDVTGDSRVWGQHRA